MIEVHNVGFVAPKRLPAPHDIIPHLLPLKPRGVTHSDRLLYCGDKV
jgi:hypothetical protein